MEGASKLVLIITYQEELHCKKFGTLMGSPDTHLGDWSGPGLTDTFQNTPFSPPSLQEVGYSQDPKLFRILFRSALKFKAKRKLAEQQFTGRVFPPQEQFELIFSKFGALRVQIIPSLL